MVSVDENLEGKMMRLRPSMRKFDVTPEEKKTAKIEIARAFDHPNPTYLNRFVFVPHFPWIFNLQR
jgi:hypothetical protein